MLLLPTVQVKVNGMPTVKLFGWTTSHPDDSGLVASAYSHVPLNGSANNRCCWKLVRQQRTNVRHTGTVPLVDSTVLVVVVM